MKEYTIKAFCDMEYAQDRKARVPAVQSITINIGHGNVELDLCQMHLDGLGTFIQAGRTVGGKRTYNYTHGDIESSREYYRGLRAWADATGRKYKGTTQKNGGMSYSYTTALREEYEAYLAGQALPPELLRTLAYGLAMVRILRAIKPRKASPGQRSQRGLGGGQPPLAE